MGAARAGHRLARKIARDNPHATVKPGRSHYKILVGGKLVGILPQTPMQEGLSANLRAQLRRAGLKVG